MVEANGLGSSLEYPLDPPPHPCSRRRRCRLGNKAPNPSEKGARGYDLYELSSTINEYEIDLRRVSLGQLMVGERICVSALAIEFLFWRGGGRLVGGIGGGIF